MFGFGVVAWVGRRVSNGKRRMSRESEGREDVRTAPRGRRRRRARLSPQSSHLDHGDKVLRHLSLRQLLAHLAQRLGRPVAHDRLLDRRQRLQRRQQAGRVRGAADERHKVAELLRHGQQHLVLVVAVFGQEWDELVAGALLAQGQGDGGQALDRVEAADGVLVLQLVAVFWVLVFGLVFRGEMSLLVSPFGRRLERPSSKRRSAASRPSVDPARAHREEGRASLCARARSTNRERACRGPLLLLVLRRAPTRRPPPGESLTLGRRSGGEHRRSLLPAAPWRAAAAPLQPPSLLLL